MFQCFADKQVHINWEVHNRMLQFKWSLNAWRSPGRTLGNQYRCRAVETFQIHGENFQQCKCYMYLFVDAKNVNI